MNQELTLKLVTRFPVIYQDFYSPMTETCMCWGFDTGAGWYDTIWQLSLAIEEELGYSWLQERWFLLKKNFARRWNNFVYTYLSPAVQDKQKMMGSGIKDDPYHWVVVEKVYPRDQWLRDLLKKILPDREDDFKSKWIGGWQRLGFKTLVIHPDTGFKVVQVKEKFGTLCFYCGGNDRIDNFVGLAERLSAVTCETCGKPGKLRGGSWLYTACDGCDKSRKEA
jgi:hypothetical protein